MKEAERLKREVERNDILEGRVTQMVWDMLLQYDVVMLMHISF